MHKEILINILQNQQAEITFPSLKIDINSIILNKCYRALKQIKDIIHDDTLDDKECFLKIEKIVCTLEGIGSDGGPRHDL